jgi:hypothetical protein
MPLNAHRDYATFKSPQRYAMRVGPRRSSSQLSDALVTRKVVSGA